MENEIDKYVYLINKYKWKFAKSMPKNPHEYIVKDNIDIEDIELFEDFVLYIRNFGIKAKFFKCEYDYLLIGDYYYWTMGNPISDTKILNRAHINNSSLKKVRNYYIMEISENVLL